MQKLIFTLVTFFFVVADTSAQNWDNHMRVKKMSIQVTTDAFTATTFIEMEFFNPTSTEMEGLYGFRLDTGQAITAFQLDLFGNYRDGSIEEKWKATNAYNTIVGKKVDPALLTMDYRNNYSLRIYPVPAMNSRKITMTIQQMLKADKGYFIYRLPLAIRDSIEELRVQIDVNSSSGLPTVIKGLLRNEIFNPHGDHYTLEWIAGKVKAEQALSFRVPLSTQQYALCIKPAEGKNFFALRLQPGVPRHYDAVPGKITVFWDVSVSGTRRDIASEISFLKQFVSSKKIAQLTIITFNHRVKDTAVFFTGANSNGHWANYLQSLKYEGAKQFGTLDFLKQDADAILLFSDGHNSFGTAVPTPGKVPVFCLSSASTPNTNRLKKMVGLTGGTYIDLRKSTMEEAVEAAGRVQNLLLYIKAGNTKLDIDQPVADLRGEVLLLSGTLPPGENVISMCYGNNGVVREMEEIIITADNSCPGSAIDRLGMLSEFDSYLTNNYWMNSLEFGKQEKVVTPYTAFIVLEKIEDYIKFNIMPPKDLESKCDMNIFVKADAQRKLQVKQPGQQEVLALVAQSYNERLALWMKDETLIDLTEQKQEQRQFTTVQTMGQGLDGRVKGVAVRNDFAGSDKVLMASEVVVTAMGQSRQPKELGYSVSRIRAAELTSGKPVNLQNGLTGKVSGLNVTTTNSGVFADTRITLRGIRSLTGNNQPMIVLDGLPIDGQFLSLINPNDVNDVTILKSASATAIYGPDGANGALIITTKKGSRGYYSYNWSGYKLKNRQDEDYLVDIKNTLRADKLNQYQELKKIHGDQAGFYFDMAQHLFESGYRQEASAILYSAAEIAMGSKQVMKAIGYTLEAWSEFNEAIKIYRQLLLDDETDLRVCRDLALALYQNGNFQEAVNVFYEGISKAKDYSEFERKSIKAMMLQEMNAIIAVHGKELDISAFNKEFIKPISVDLRIILDRNDELQSAISIKEPGGLICSDFKQPANGGRVTKNNDPRWNNPQPQEYQVKEARSGKYRISVRYYDHYYSAGSVPSMIRIATFRNFGKPGQSIEIKNVIMDNQYGDVEIGEVKW